MSDLISRQAVIDNAFETNTKEYGNIEVVGIDAIMALPTIDAVPVRHGRWIETKEFHGYDNEFPRRAYACSECHVAFLEDPVHPNGGITIECKDDHDCVFCDHCTDVFWDYTNLIYMIFCEDEHDPRKRPCKYFEERAEE